MKRPSLAASMKAAAKPEPVPVPAQAERPAYYAATREGKKRLTVVVEPEQHRRVKLLAVNSDRTVEDLMREALADLLAKKGA